MPGERIEFGSVLSKDTGEKKIWLFVILAALGVVGLVAWAVSQGSRTSSLDQEARAAKAQVAELEKSLAERDKLITDARAEEGVMRSPGQALGVFYSADPRAQESGIVFAHPEAKAARVYLYGLGTPPEGQEYAVAARTGDGEGKLLGRVMADERGNGFLLAQEVPEDAVAVELVYSATGQEGLDGATPRIAARWPSAEERGILATPPAQARRGAARP
jgi:hypothetical protein